MNLPPNTFNILVVLLLLVLVGLLAFNVYVSVSTNNGLSLAFGTRITAFPSQKPQQDYVV